MAQTKKAFDEVRIPLSNMSFSPDVPSTALGPNEYNSGSNVETDVRGIRSTLGDQAILPDGVPGTPTFITGGYRKDGYFWFVVATSEGDWWASNGQYVPNSGSGIWININPVGLNETYTQAQNITGDWNGTVPFFNDAQTAPMFWQDTQNHVETTTVASGDGTTATLTFAALTAAPYVAGDRIIVKNVVPDEYNGLQTVTACTTTTVSFLSTATGAQTTAGTIEGPIPFMTQYSQTLPAGISTITVISPGEQQITFDVPYATAPYVAGERITISDINTFYDGTFTVVSSTTTTLNYKAAPSAVYPGGSIGSVAPEYSWNYNPEWSSVYAGFLRLYTTPNVGSILVAGNLTATLPDGTVNNYPVTVQWSQKFGLNQAPGTWEPTVLNVANQLEVPLRGTVLDAFPANGNLYLQSYWDTVVLSPINFTTTVTPILGNRLFNLGRGLLSANCWCNADNTVFGIDARDIWVFDGKGFQGLGNQRVKNWFFDQLDPLYVERVFMVLNTQKNQVEIYYPTVDAANGVPNKMLSYRTDLNIWNAPRDVNSATFACESPLWAATPNLEWNNKASTAVTGTGTGFRLNINQQGSAYKAYANQGDIAAAGTGYAIGNQVKFLGTVLGGTSPANDAFAVVTAINGSGGVTDFAQLTGQANGAYISNPGSRTVVYARGDTLKRIVQKDIGYNFISDINGEVLPIVSSFRRDNIKMIQDYSGKLLVHRVMPEVVNLTQKSLPINPTTQPNLIGSVDIKLEGANSVGQEPQATTALTMATNTDYPWVQVNQNAHRVNSLELGDSSETTAWMCSATTWQFTQTEDDR